MKITEVRKKVKKCKDLLSEYNMLYLTLKVNERVNTTTGLKLDGKFLYDMKKRMGIIELQFDQLLK